MTGDRWSLQPQWNGSRCVGCREFTVGSAAPIDRRGDVDRHVVTTLLVAGIIGWWLWFAMAPWRRGAGAAGVVRRAVGGDGVGGGE